MSWNNVLPWWFYELESEHWLAKMQCCFEDEWYSGTSKVMPDHVIMINPATFGSWEEGGWNYGKDDE